MNGNVHSIITGSTVDGPGTRYVVFLKGCPLRCLYCHNPDTWDGRGGEEKTVAEIIEDMKKYMAFMKRGGITVSGGEPLVQIDFLIELFTERLCSDNPTYLSDVCFRRSLKICKLFLSTAYSA